MSRPVGGGRAALLLDILDRNYSGHSWQGSSLRGVLQGLGPKRALWRPGKGRHNCWELALHAAYWKYAIRRRLAGGGVARFPRGPRNFPALPEPADARAWRDDLALMDEQHRLLCEAVAELPDAALDRPLTGRWTVAASLHGLASHDSYHTGQMRLIVRMMQRKT